MRKLASVRTVTKIVPIKDRDKIELVFVGGWSVISQKGLYAVDDKVVYLEPDSVLPENEIFKNLLGERFKTVESQDEETGEVNRGHRLATMKMAGVVSHGMILCKSIYSSIDGTDLTEFYGIKKYGKPFNAQNRERVLPSHLLPFPKFLRKTDQERVQNLVDQVWECYQKNVTFEVTQKLHGESVTFFKSAEHGYGMCSRNYQLTHVADDGHTSNSLAKSVIEKLENFAKFGYAFQGERLSPSLHKNFENVKGEEYHVFNVYDILEGRYLNPKVAKDLVEYVGLVYVPVLAANATLKEIFGVVEDKNILVELLINNASGKSVYHGGIREGLVFKSLDEKDWNGFSFKVISNEFLLKTK